MPPLEALAAGNFNALRIDPACTIIEDSRDRAANIGGKTDTATLTDSNKLFARCISSRSLLERSEYAPLGTTISRGIQSFLDVPLVIDCGKP